MTLCTQYVGRGVAGSRSQMKLAWVGVAWACGCGYCVLHAEQSRASAGFVHVLVIRSTRTHGQRAACDEAGGTTFVAINAPSLRTMMQSDTMMRCACP